MTSAREQRQQIAERQEKVWEMRLQMMSVNKIAKVLNVTHPTVLRDLKAMSAQTVNLRRADRAAMEFQLMELIANIREGVYGNDFNKVYALLKVLDQLAKLQHLYETTSEATALSVLAEANILPESVADRSFVALEEFNEKLKEPAAA